MRHEMLRVISPLPLAVLLLAAVAAALPLAAQTPVEEPAFQTPSSQGVAVEAAPPQPAFPSPMSAQALGAEKRTAESASTPYDRNPARHQQFLERAKIGKLDLLLLGDALLDLLPKNGEWTWLRFAPANPADFAVSGERTDDVLWRVQNGELDAIHPKVVVLQVGTSNFFIHRSEQPDWVAAGVRKIVETIHAKLPAARVLVLGLFPRGAADDPLRPKIEAANALLARLDDGKATRYLDPGKKFFDDKGNIPPDVMADRLHPTARGYEVWWEAMHPLLDELMAAPALAPSPSPGPSASPTPTPAKAAPPPAKGAKGK